MRINWKVRFSRNNLLFWFRFLSALFIPVISYMGIRYDDLTTWPMIWNVIIQFFSNPFLIGLTIFSAVNIIPDPVVKGISDSQQALTYTEPKKSAGPL